jgi:hypothetical protein
MYLSSGCVMADSVETEKSVWLNPFGLAMVAYYLVMALVGICIPDDILKANAWAREFSDFMASIVSQIDRITQIGIKPDVNRFYFSVLWAGSPLLLSIASLMIWDAKRRGVAPVWTTPFWKSFWPILFGFFVCVFVWQVTWMTDPSLRISRFYFANPIGRGLLGQTFVFGLIFFGSGIVLWALGWLTGYIPRNIERQHHG